MTCDDKHFLIKFVFFGGIFKTAKDKRTRAVSGQGQILGVQMSHVVKFNSQKSKSFLYLTVCHSLI